MKLKQLRQEQQNFAFKSQQLEQEIEQLQNKLQRFEKDPQIFESIARDQLGVAKEGEIVVDIVR